jgi:hypothetical protein
MRAEATVTFADVATKIANGNPPPWLLIGLNHFSKFIRLEPKLTSKEDMEIDEHMLAAAQYLTKWLPVYAYLEEFGFEYPDCVDTASNALHELIEILEKEISEARTGPGLKPNIQQRICASVVVEAWRLIHDGKVKHRSRVLLEACIDYWLACGRELTDEINEPENWRRIVGYVINEGEGVREILERYRMSE